MGQTWDARRRVWIAFGLVAALALALLAGLSSPSAANSASNKAAANDVLVIDNVFNNKGLDPQREASVTANIALHAMYDTLLTFNGADTTPVPAIAQSWVVSPDGKSVTFKLRKDIKFSDGTRLNAHDVVFSYKRLQNIKGNQAFLLAGLEMKATGTFTVVLTSPTPNPALLRIVQSPSLSIVNTKAVLAHGGNAKVNANNTDKAEEWLSGHSVGTGPYKLKTYTPQQQIVLVPNPNWRGDAPKWKQIVIRNMAAATQFLNVQRGTNEIAYDIPAQQVSSLSGNKNLQIVTAPSTNMFFFNVNMKPGVTIASNPHILNAIRYGLDYDALVALGGPGSVRMPGMVPQGMLGALPESAAIKRDIPKAKAEIAASGISNPAFELAYVADFSFSGVDVATLAQKVQASLAEVGLKVDIKGYPLAPYLQLRKDGKLGASASLFGADYPDPSDYLTFTPGGNSAKQVFWFEGADAQATALANQAKSEMNDAKRAKLYQQLQQRLNQIGPFIPQFQPAAVLVGGKNLTGLVRNSVWGIDVAAVGTK